MQNIEKRTTPRTALKADALVQRLGVSPSGNGVAFPVQVIDAGQRGMRLCSQEAMDAGQAVKVEMGDAMFLGEICYCAPAPAGEGYHLGVVTKECLSGLSSLQHLIQALAPQPAPEFERSR